MKDLEEIKYYFENKSYLVRGEFINEYDFNDPYKEYYKNFIIHLEDIKDHLYLSDLIDLSSWMEFYEIEIRRKWFEYLEKPSHFIVRLAVLDYFKHCSKKLLFRNYEQVLLTLLNQRLSSVVRNQILVNLIVLRSRNQNMYMDQLFSSLARTNDWRSIYRTINNFNEVDALKELKDKAIAYIVELHEQKDYGEGVSTLLKGFNKE